MKGEYKTLNDTNLESRVLFFGKESCLPNYSFTGNNVRQNYVIHYIIKGKGTFTSANHSVTQLKAGDIFILPKGVPCFYQADSEEPWSYFWIGLSGLKISTMLSGSILSSQHYLHQVQNSKFYASLQKLYEALHNPNSLTNDILIESLIYQTFYYLDTEYPAKLRKIRVESSVQLKMAIKYLHDNFDDHNCSITSLCHKLDISRSYLYNIFKHELNTSPQKFLIQIRMEEAKNRLKNTSSSVQQISNLVGYIDEFTFSKAFKRYTGFSPKIYRQMNKKSED
ncbi:AraC family transcriptional regulator [Lactobacillus hamsteri]|nr:AraC family transcriptional regulator [Lactobacillus hamsteri]